MDSTAISLDALSPAERAGAPRAEHDFWEFISGTVIQRFIDYYWVKHGVSHETLKAYRTDLIALDRWMLLFKHKTLVTATEGDIREFLDAKYRAGGGRLRALDRKSTRLNSSHMSISYAVFCLKKKIV